MITPAPAPTKAPTKSPAPKKAAAPQPAHTRGAAPAREAPAPAGPAVTLGNSPAQNDPRFKKVMDKLQHSAAKTKAHPPASKKAAEAQAAAHAPTNAKMAGAEANQVEVMKGADTKKPQPTSFLAMLRAEIQKVMPKKVSDTKDFMKGDDKQQLKGAMTGNINQQKEEATDGIKTATEQQPNTAAVPDKEVTPIPAEANPSPAAVSAREGMPAPKTDSDVSLQSGKQDADKMMKDADITPTQMDKANDPRFSAVNSAKGKADEYADKAPNQFRGEEQKTLAQAAAKATGDEKLGLNLLHGAKTKSGAEVKTRQLTAKEKDEARRKQVADDIEKIFNETKETVEKKLSSLESDVGNMFDQGADAAINKMKKTVEDKFDDRYSGISGKALWLKDKFLPLPDAVKAWFDDAYKVFLQDLDELVVTIANLVETRLKDAKAEIDKGQKRIHEYVEKLPKDLQDVGKAAEKEMADRFNDLRKSVDEKKHALAQKLAQRYKEAYDKGNAALKAMKDAHKSLLEKLRDAIMEVIRILREFKDRLVSMLKKGWETIKLIVADPIGFLKNLLAAIKKGINQFKDRIWDHLKEGFIAWLMGPLAEAGITMPKDLSLPSILKLVLEVLGLTYERIRTKAVKLIGERNVMLLEKAFELLKALWLGGPAALWEKIKEFIGDLKAQVIDAIQNWVITAIVKAAITKLVSMFNPVGAIIQAIITIYNTVMFFIERINQIMALVEAIINSVSAIATGAIDTAANWIEKTLARTIPVILGFLARLLGISGITDTIIGFIKKIQSTVDKAIDKVIEKVVAGIGKLFGKGDKKDAVKGDVKEQVRGALIAELKADHTRPQAQAIIKQIEQQYKPMGLKRLQLGEENEDGVSEIIAEASPALPLAQLLKSVPKPRGRSVTVVVQLTLRVPENIPATLFKPTDERRATIPTGGAVWTPRVGSSTTLNVVTWNTSNIDAPGNSSHAEHQFVEWLRARPSLMANVEKIMVNNFKRSPCSICAPELAALLREIRAARGGLPLSADIYWTQLHSTGAQPTSWQGLNKMQQAGWVLHAPGTALPPEKDYYAGQVFVKLI